MTTEGEEITVHGLHINLEVRRTLCSVNRDGNAVSMGYSDDFLNRIHCAQHIADMGHTDDLGLISDKRFELIHTEDTIVGNGKMLYDNASFHGLQLPRDDVRVMLHFRDDHLVTSLHLRFAERRGYEINRLCGPARKDDLLCLAGIDKLAHLFACRLMQVGGLLAQVVDATMHIGIHIEVLVAHRIEHTQRLLRSSSIVEIDQWLTIDLS